MITDTDVRSDYSSDVSLHLEAEGQVWPLAKIGPDHVVPRERFDLPPCDAEIVMTVDGDERRWRVRLVRGVCYFDSTVRVKQF